MNPEFQYNSEKNRFETIDDKCLFCNTNQVKEHKNNVFVPLYKIEQYDNLLIAKRYKYKKTMLVMKRCRSCKNIFTRAQFLAVLAVLAFMGLALLLMVYLFNNKMFTYFFISIILTIFCSLMGYVFLLPKLSKRLGVQDHFEKLRSLNVMKYLAQQGYSPVPPH